MADPEGTTAEGGIKKALVPQITKLFNLLDQDSSGSLDVKEIKFFVRKVMGVDQREESRKIAREMVTTLDKDGDRSIDVLEFIEGITNMEFAGSSLDTFLDDALLAAQTTLDAGGAKIADLSKEVFQHLDTDRSGTLGIKEIKFFFRKIVGLADKDESRAAAIDFMKSMDVDHGHTLDVDEFTGGFRAMRQRKALSILSNAVEIITATNKSRIEQWATTCFEHLDKDGSKTLGIKEIKHFFRKIVGMKDKEESRQAAIDFMKSMDEDNDHELNVEEFIVGFAKMPRQNALSILQNAVTVIAARENGAEGAAAPDTA